MFKTLLLVELGTWFWLYHTGRINRDTPEQAALMIKKAAGGTLTPDEERQVEQLQQTLP